MLCFFTIVKPLIIINKRFYTYQLLIIILISGYFNTLRQTIALLKSATPQERMPDNSLLLDLVKSNRQIMAMSWNEYPSSISIRFRGFKKSY